MFTGIEHLGIMAQDPAQLAQWYQEVLGFKIIAHNHQNPPTIFVKGETGPMVEIMPKSAIAKDLSAAERKIYHLAISVTNYDAAVQVLRSKGAELGETKEGPGYKLIFFNDPEGNSLQLIYRDQPLG